MYLEDVVEVNSAAGISYGLPGGDLGVMSSSDGKSFYFRTDLYNVDVCICVILK